MVNKNRNINSHQSLLQISAIIGIVPLLSCNPHEFPSDIDEDFSASTPSKYVVTIHHNTEMTSVDFYPEMRSPSVEDVCLRYIINVFEEDQTVYQSTVYSDDFSFSDFSFDLPVSSIEDKTIYVWSDFVNASTHNTLFYNATQFDHVSISSDSYEANTDLRDCFTGHWSITDSYAISKSENITITLERPVGRYTLITHDLDKFAETISSEASLQDYSVVVTYPSYLPNSVNLFNDNVNSVATGVSYESPIKVQNDSTAILGFDYVMFTNSIDTGVAIQLSLKSPNGTLRRLTSSFNVPMHRGQNTNVIGKFLTGQVNSGFGIDFRFNGEYNIYI